MRVVTALFVSLLVESLAFQQQRYFFHGSKSSSLASRSLWKISNTQSPPVITRKTTAVRPLQNAMVSSFSAFGAADIATTATTSTFLVRICFLRAVAFVHFVAFLVAFRQNKPLIGDRGITPARYVLDDAERRAQINKNRRLEWRNDFADSDASRIPAKGFVSRILANLKGTIGQIIDSNPRLARLREILWDRTDRMGRPVLSILWMAKDRSRLNSWLDRIALAGLIASAIIFILGAANVPLVAILWLCQRSLMAVGGPFYGYGWEPQLAELSFHTLFLVPLLSLKVIPSTPVPRVIAWTIRWYLFRIMIGAGLIKLKSGDRKWKDLTTMDYFYETQPVPNPLTRYFHWMPLTWHKLEVLINHFVELVAPWLLILPLNLSAPWRRSAGLIQLAFQSVLIMSGNLSFLNWLTMVPAIMCLDDAFVGRFFSPQMRFAAMGATWTTTLSTQRKVISWSLWTLIMYLSIPVIKNLLSKRQVMNGSFDRFRLVNTYGAFGSVSTEREEFIISAASSVEGPWKEYEFQVKPGDPYRHPKWLSPYHHRIDWQMWIAATCKSLERSPWMFVFLEKLLQQDPDILKLLRGDPWRNCPDAPKYIRIDSYRYQFHRKQPNETDPPYWDRHFIGRVYPRAGVATVESLKEEIKRRQPSRPV